MSNAPRSRSQLVEKISDCARDAMLTCPVTTEQLFSKYHRPLRDVRSENLVVTALPAVTAMRFLAGSIFEFFATLGRPNFAAGEDFFPQHGDVILMVADQDEPDVIQGLAMVRTEASVRGNEDTDSQDAAAADESGYLSASYDLIWTMIHDEDRAVKLLVAAYLAAATRTGMLRLAQDLKVANNTTKEDLAISYEYRDRHDDEVYQMMVDDLVLVVGELGNNARIREQFNQFGWLTAL